MRQRKPQRYERYALEDSPWAQKLSQRDLAELLGYTKTQLEALIRDKDKWVGRRTEMIGSKLRNLAVPKGKLRAVHERLKFHLNKIKQPDYLFSPRKGRAQRDNAEHHVSQHQFLSLDIRQFYPSTTSEHIFRWAHHELGLRTDVAGMLVHLVSVDGRMPFGSPISPVLTTLVHRSMFDAIKQICHAYDLRMSLWVDDLTISGRVIPGTLIEDIRAEMRQRSFQTHKIQFRTGNRSVIVTGVPIEGDRIAAPRSVHERVRTGYAALRAPLPDIERAHQIDKLLSALGTQRYHVGRSSPEGRRAANRMNALRQRRSGLSLSVTTLPTATIEGVSTDLPPPGSSLPWY